MAEDKTVNRVEIKQLDFAPSQKTGLHLHPCLVVGYIACGAARFQVSGEVAKVLRQGDSFFEPANIPILQFDNASDSEPLTFIAIYLMGRKDRELIKLLE